MAAVIAARRIRDKMPRWLWELQVECGHLQYEIVERVPQVPANVMCRACQAEHRLRVLYASIDAARAAVADREDAPDILSVACPEKPFALDGGTQGPAPAVQVEARALAAPHPLPACMRPRPDSAPARRISCPSGPGSEGKRRAARGPGKPDTRRPPDLPGQTLLFEV